MELGELKATHATEQVVQADPREIKIGLLADLIEAGTVDAGYHRACKHDDTVRAKAECGLRRYEVQKRKEEANLPSAVCGSHGAYVHRSVRTLSDGVTTRGITAVRTEPKVNQREAKRARVKSRKLAAEAHA